MALGKEQELVWQGRLHVGDEPGTFGNAAYCGLACEFPLTLRRFDGGGGESPVLVIHAEHVKIYPGYKGHDLTVMLYEPVAGSQPPVWKERVLASSKLTGDQTRVPLSLPSQNASVTYVSVRIRAATDVAPGLYDEFVVRGIELRSGKHGYHAQVGFDYHS